MQGHSGSILPQRKGVAPIDENTLLYLDFQNGIRDKVRGEMPIGFDYAAGFNGSSSYIKTNRFPETPGMSIALWFYPTTNSGHLFWGSNTDKMIARLLNNLSISWYVGTVNGNVGYISTTQKYMMDKWNHFALVYDGETVKVYLNGVEDTSTGTVSGNSGNAAMHFGTTYNANSQWFEGRMSNICVWGYGIRGDEVIDAMACKPHRENLMAYYELGEQVEGVIYDHSSNMDDLIPIDTSIEPGMRQYQMEYDNERGNVVRLEEGSINLASDVSYTVYAYARHEGEFGYQNPDGRDKVQKFTRSSETGMARGKKNLPAIAGKTYGVSFKMKTREGLSHFYSPNKPLPESGNSISTTEISSSETDIGDGWVKHEAVYKIEANTTDTSMFCFGIHNGDIGDEFLVYDIHWEEKSVNTAYTDNKREDSFFVYPSPLKEDEEEITISFWAKRLSKRNEHETLLCIDDSIQKNLLSIDMQRDTVLRFFVYETETVHHMTSSNIGAGTVDNWFFVTAVRDKDGNNRLFCNGEKIAEKQTPKTYYKGLIRLGHRITSNIYDSNILIDQVMVENIARSEEEISARYRQIRAGV